MTLDVGALQKRISDHLNAIANPLGAEVVVVVPTVHRLGEQVTYASRVVWQVEYQVRWTIGGETRRMTKQVLSVDVFTRTTPPTIEGWAIRNFLSTLIVRFRARARRGIPIPEQFVPLVAESELEE